MQLVKLLYVAHQVLGLLNYRTHQIPPNYPFHTAELSPFHPDIHGLSNVGQRGKTHALFAVCATNLIDLLAYDGRNVRMEISTELYARSSAGCSVVDIGCSVGVFTACLWRAGFRNLSAVDSSPQMLQCAKLALPPSVSLFLGNAAIEIPQADIIVCGFVMHELPSVARTAILDNAYTSLCNNGTLLVVDIDPSYSPTRAMLSGEPFLLDYQRNFEIEVKRSKFRVERQMWIEEHVFVYWCIKDDQD